MLATTGGAITGTSGRTSTLPSDAVGTRAAHFSASTTVCVRDGETLLTDGPAAEIKEHFGGFTLVECADLDEALRWAARVPTASDGRVEVRPLIQVVAPAEQPAG